MQKRHSKQRKERSGKGNGEFRVVTILDEIIERKKKKNRNQPKQNMSSLPKMSRPLFFLTVNPVDLKIVL